MFLNAMQLIPESFLDKRAEFVCAIVNKVAPEQPLEEVIAITLFLQQSLPSCGIIVVVTAVCINLATASQK